MRTPIRFYENVMDMLYNSGQKSKAALIDLICECYKKDFNNMTEFERYWSDVETSLRKSCAKYAQIQVLKPMLYKYHQSRINNRKSNNYKDDGGDCFDTPNDNISFINKKEEKRNNKNKEEKEREKNKNLISSLSLDEPLEKRKASFKKNVCRYNILMAQSDKVYRNDENKYYDDDTTVKFFEYWSEPGSNGLMRCENEKSWDYGVRLNKWFDNEKNKSGQMCLSLEEALKYDPETKKVNIFLD